MPYPPTCPLAPLARRAGFPSRRALHDAAGLHPDRLYQVVTTRARPRLATLRALARALGTSPRAVLEALDAAAVSAPETA